MPVLPWLPSRVLLALLGCDQGSRRYSAMPATSLAKSLATLVDCALMQTEGSDATHVNQEYITRSLNRLRQKDRPLEPNSLDFEVANDFIPKEFLQIFATTEQLSLLKKAKTWHMNATFRVVRETFQQLFGIHAFVKGDENNIKQVPLAFALMSRKRKKDFKKSSKCYINPNSGVQSTKIRNGL